MNTTWNKCLYMQCKEEYVSPLTKPLESREIPADWMAASMTPICNKGAANYRWVSIYWICCQFHLQPSKNLVTERCTSWLYTKQLSTKCHAMYTARYHHIGDSRQGIEKLSNISICFNVLYREMSLSRLCINYRSILIMISLATSSTQNSLLFVFKLKLHFT